MSEAAIQKLLATARLESVQANIETAVDELKAARTHIPAARKIAGDDPTLALTGAYDAMRKSISAHMRAKGYRVPKGPGHHIKTGEYAAAALDNADIQQHIDAFDALRTMRNQSEYDARFIGRDDVDDALGHAEAMLDAVVADLGVMLD